MNKKGQLIKRIDFWILIISIVVVALIFGEGTLSEKIIIFLIMALLINPILSFWVNSIIDSLGFKWLEEINFTCEIAGYEISITAYALLTEIILFVIF